MSERFVDWVCFAEELGEMGQSTAPQVRGRHLRGSPSSSMPNLKESQAHQARNGTEEEQESGASGSFICDDTGCSGSFVLPKEQVEKDTEELVELGESRTDATARGQQLASIPFAALFGNLQNQLQHDAAQLGDSRAEPHRSRKEPQIRRKKVARNSEMARSEGRLMQDINSHLAASASHSSGDSVHSKQHQDSSVTSLWKKLKGAARIKVRCGLRCGLHCGLHCVGCVVGCIVWAALWARSVCCRGLNST